MLARPLFILLALSVTTSPDLAGQVKEPTVPPPVNIDNRNDDVRTILTRYAAAWRGREALPGATAPIAIGFEITGAGGGSYHLQLPPEGPGTLHDGLPVTDWEVIFQTDMEFLRRLDRGEISALTALGQAQGNDPTPLVPRFPPGFRWTVENRARMLPLVFHFWNRESPPILRFGEGSSRRIHGGDMAVFYYDVGLRTAWARIQPGVHVNEDPKDQANPFPSLVIVTRGIATARIGGREMILQEGQAVLVPAGVTHEFWATEDQYGECVIIMFGPGA
jgi:mannose-6-phosphate isomerase-like protein (cupin superfamily)